jgi:hypothetical protein
MASSVKTLASKMNRVQEKRRTLLTKIGELEKDLLDTFSDSEIYGTSSDMNLQQTGGDDYIYGHLSFSEDGLSIAYRSTEDDYYDNFHGASEEDKTYKIKHFSTCSANWLERIFVEKYVSMLLEDLNTKVDEMDGLADQSLNLMTKILETESAEINAQMVTTLKRLGDENLNKSWIAAHGAVSFDPADSLTRSNSFLESVCKRILKDRSAEIPQTITISTLIDACIRTLTWPFEKEAQEDVKKITAGIKSISGGIGSLRTHFGTAHGASSDQTPLDPSFARLSNNACATVAIFLLQRHFKNMAD